MAALHWDFEPSIILGIVLWIGVYAIAVNPMRSRMHWGAPVPRSRQIAFHLGTLCAFLALVSPLDTLADNTLFSAHMVQHMLLIFVAPPLWLVGTPGWLIKRLFSERLLNVITHPIIAFTIFNSVMWVWHIPAVYDAALANPMLHIIEHLAFMGSALIGWSPVLGADINGRMSPPLKLAYLIPSLFSCTALAALITLSSTRLYPFYGDAPLQWGLTPMTDQQIGGLTMWLPGDMLHLFLIVFLVNRWLDSTSTQLQQVKI